MTSPARTIIKALKGRWYSDYGAARCPAHEDRKPSLRVRDGERGAPLVSCYAGCDRLEIIAALKQMGIWPERDHGARRDDWQPRPRRRYASPSRPAPALRTLTAEETERVGFAQGIWETTLHAEGSIVERYWREARGLTLPIPIVIRFSAKVPRQYPTPEKPVPQTYPAMVAMVQAPGGSFAGIHATYLRPDGSDRDRRLERLVFGCVGRSAIRLAEAADHLVVGEGIETTASYMQELKIAGWAAMNTSGLRTILLPPPPTAIMVTLLGENDEAKGPRQIVASDAAIKAALPRLRSEGRLVDAVFPAEGFKDFNDPLKRQL